MNTGEVGWDNGPNASAGYEQFLIGQLAQKGIDIDALQMNDEVYEIGETVRDWSKYEIVT